MTHKLHESKDKKQHQKHNKNLKGDTVSLKNNSSKKNVWGFIWLRTVLTYLQQETKQKTHNTPQPHPQKKLKKQNSFSFLASYMIQQIFPVYFSPITVFL
jgi:hypothetical protein